MGGVEVSVINQVLNQLEQRGENTVQEQTMVRAVPQTRRKLALPLLIVGLVLAIGLAAWQWMQIRKPVLSTVEEPKVVAVNVAQYQPVVAVSAPVFVVPVAAATTAPAEKIVLAEVLPPASRLSFELSSVTLPSTLHQENEQSVSTGSGHAASAGSGQALRKTKSISATSAGASAQPLRESAKPKSTQIALSSANAKAVVETSSGVLPMKQVSSAQQADAEFGKATVLMQQGRIADAVAGYEVALRLDAGHNTARQALVALLLEGKRGADAERVLQDGLKVKPEHTGFAMLLARLQVERGAVDLASATLEKSLPYADSQIEYQAFFAALLQRQSRHKEAISHYQIALKLAPNNGVWLMGYGISLQAAQRNTDAKDAFRRALESKTLTPELQAFVQGKIKGL
jgi:MSHA biogenesis protein MshN